MNSLGKRLFFLVYFFSCLAAMATTNGIQTLDLKPFVGKSQFTRFDAEWTLPRGRQVADGVPFQFDGIIELYGKSALQKGLEVRTNVYGIPVGSAFDELHLLCATTGGSPTGKTAVATIQLNYGDGSSNQLGVIFGTHIRQWWGQRHEEDTPLLDRRSKPAWSMEMSEAARNDKRSRFFHTVLTNPAPGKTVKSVDLLSTKTVAGILIAGMSVGPREATALPDTLPNLPPDADTVTREGKPAQVEGFVQDTKGANVSNALVRIISARGVKAYEDHTAGPSVGRETRTDATGHFQLEKLPDDQIYRVMVLAEGSGRGIFAGVDPHRGPVSIRLLPEKELVPTEKYFLRGKVVGPDNQPVIGATIEPRGVGTDRGRSWGGSQGFLELVTTERNGEFLLERKEAFNAVQIIVQTAGLARQNLWLDRSNTVQTIQLAIGATISGRVVQDGKPLANVGVGIRGANRNAEVYAGEYQTKTDQEGHFQFDHLPPRTGWNLFGDIASLQRYGAIRTMTVTTGTDGDKKDLGDLEVKPGLTLSGTVQLIGGKSLPKKLEVWASYDTGGMSKVFVDQNGRFEFTGLWSGLLQVSVQPSDWVPTGANRSIDEWNPWWLIGKFEQSKNDLLLVVEKRARDYDNRFWNGNGQLPQEDQARQRPLMGAEDSGPGWIRFAGRVIDDKTETPIAQFKVTQGRKPPVIQRGPKPLAKRIVETFGNASMPPHERPYWDSSRTETFTNGTFKLAMMPLTSTPMLRIEAAGFEPFETEPMPSGVTDLVIRLKKGKGPSGTVVLSGGAPANGATIILARNNQQFSLHGTELTTYGEKEQLQRTKGDGKFSFPPNPNGQRLFVSHTNGWANLSLSRFSDGDEIELQPWATVTGILVNAKGQPVANEKLALMMGYDWNRGDAFVNLQQQPTTDAKGKFRFVNVPPQALQLHRMVPSGTGGGMRYQLQMPFVCEPGKLNDLGNVVIDTPPPPSALDEVKRKLGF